MADRIQAVVVVPRDGALPIDVQGVNLRRKAIDLMQEVGKVKESTVRYKGATEDATVSLGDELMSLRQHNAVAALFYADGEVDNEFVFLVVHRDPVTRTHSAVSFVRDEYS